MSNEMMGAVVFGAIAVFAVLMFAMERRAAAKRLAARGGREVDVARLIVLGSEAGEGDVTHR